MLDTTTTTTRHKPPGAPDPYKSRKGATTKLSKEVEAVLDRSEYVSALDISRLNLDPTYQYIPDQEFNRLNQLKNYLAEAGGFKPFLAGAIQVHRRPDGSLWTLDGGGRSWMASSSGVRHLPAFIAEGLTLAQEEEAFRFLNKNKRVIRAPHIFVSAGRTGVEPNATIVKLADQAKYCIERDNSNRKRAQLGAGALLFVHQLGEDVLEMALLDLRVTWGDFGNPDEEKDRAKLINGQALIAFAICRAAGGRKFKQKRFRDVMSRKENNIYRLGATARSNAAAVVTTRTPQSRDIAPELAKTVIGAYNTDLLRSRDVRITWDDVLALRSRFDDNEQYQDVWRWPS